ncbi:hypothetical protein Aph02nite_77050 [Actinoplanes philippinensis]|nr:hypothetical protein Aph02nite_77050 [Actinoplanes philippinensis]
MPRRGRDRAALVHGAVSHSWPVFAGRVRAVAAMLHTLGVRPGDGVVFAAPLGPATLEVALGCARIGAVFTPMAAGSSPDALVDAASRCGAPVILAGPANAAVRAWTGTLIDLGRDYERLLAGATGTPPAGPQGDAPFCRFPADGDTVLTHTAVAAAGDTLAGVTGLRSASVNLVAAPLIVAAAFVQAVTAIRYGATTVLPVDGSPATVLDTMARAGVTHAFVTPGLLAAVVAEPRDRIGPLPARPHVLYAHGRLTPAIARACTTELRTDLARLHGCAEIGGMLTLLSPEDHRDGSRTQRLASVGRPLPGVLLRIVDPASRRALATGRPGLVQAWTAGTGDRWIDTGDTGCLDADGYLYLTAESG